MEIITRALSKWLIAAFTLHFEIQNVGSNIADQNLKIRFDFDENGCSGVFVVAECELNN